MAIITKGSITKGTPAPITLNKDELEAIVNDVYFQDQSNWSKVTFYYKSSTGEQTVPVEFDVSDASPVALFSASTKARPAFNIEKIMIHDFDGDIHPIVRSELSAHTSYMDITFGPPPYLRNFVTLPSAQAGESQIHPNGTLAYTVDGLRITAEDTTSGTSVSFAASILGLFPSGNFKLTMNYVVESPYNSAEASDLRLAIGNTAVTLGAGDDRIDTAGEKTEEFLFNGANPDGNAGYGAGKFVLVVVGAFGQQLLIKSIKIEVV